MIKDKKTAIVGSIVGCVILLTIFCCEGNKEAVEAAPVEAAPVEAAVEEVAPIVEEVTPEAVEEAVEEVTPEVEETPAVEEVVPAESVE